MTLSFACFFFNDTATTEIYTLSLHDSLPIYGAGGAASSSLGCRCSFVVCNGASSANSSGAVTCSTSTVTAEEDRKSTRLNSSHANISYAVFCLKKKNTQTQLIYYDSIGEAYA